MIFTTECVMRCQESRGEGIAVMSTAAKRMYDRFEIVE